MTNFKRFLSVFIIMVITLSNLNINVLADEFPSSFWSINSKYEEAVNVGDHVKIIEYGCQIIDLMQNVSESSEKRNTLVTRANQVGNSYAAIGEYDNAAAVFSSLYDYVQYYADDFYDYTISTKAQANQYASDIRLYTNGGQFTYYGAVNEKQNGVLYGMCANGATNSKLDSESMVLTYQELGQSLLAYNVGVVKNAALAGQAVEFALNCPNEAKDIKNIKKMESYLKEISDLFKKYPSTPIYLRFAAEFDIWAKLPEADEFISAFQYVSNYFKQRNDNVAIVWSPNQVSNWNIDIDDYYPGDAYVDWVGVSLYAQKYFLGDPYQEEVNEIVFKSGVNSNPVIALKEIVEKYGDRKPIMLSESGCGHKVLTNGEDATEFALQRLKEYYSYLPMVYPQIKLIAYFDWHVDNETERNDFRLSSNSKLQNEYLRLVKGRRFIQGKYSNNVDFSYRQIADGTVVESIFEVSCYAHMYKAGLSSVTYFIDDKYVGESNEIPYTTMVDATDFAGNHKLKAIAKFDNGKTLTTISDIRINSNNQKIDVEISGKEIKFDQEPILYNDRTMVPMRKIFEELGATVTWDANTQTVTGKKGDRTVKVTIGQNLMYVNNKTITLDTSPLVLAGRTLVPVRAVAEGLGCTVDWEPKYNLVSITPKVFKWSEWSEDLPGNIDKNLYYIETKKEYRTRTREKEYFTLDYKLNSSNFVESQTSYGSWSDWGDEYISSSSTRDVETRTQSQPKRYYYAHYCTGNESDKSIRYKTANYQFSDKCSYHILGWYDSPLEPAEDGTGYIEYKEDGNKYRCSNTCYRWYVFDTSGGDYTQYRSRPIYTHYTYWEWGNWSQWSSWDDEHPNDYITWFDESIDVDERTVYRYKEK